MWVFTKHGFVSIVQHHDDPGIMLVRSRTIRPLETMWPDYEVQEIKWADYRYRIFVPREEVSSVIVDSIEGIEYPNFKAACTDDHEYQTALASVWWKMLETQTREGEEP
jgi:hypothetical protein